MTQIVMILLMETSELINKTLLIALLILTISGCSDKPVSCTDLKFKKLAQDAYLQQTLEKLSSTLIEQIGEYDESDKNVALERFKNNTFLKKFEFENLVGLSRDEETIIGSCIQSSIFEKLDFRLRGNDEIVG
jgi:hypothetical protein